MVSRQPARTATEHLQQVRHRGEASIRHPCSANRSSPVPTASRLCMASTRTPAPRSRPARPRDSYPAPRCPRSTARGARQRVQGGPAGSPGCRLAGAGPLASSVARGSVRACSRRARAFSWGRSPARRRAQVRVPATAAKGDPHGRRHDATAARSRCTSRRITDPALEPEDAAVHLRRAQRHLHHRPAADPRADRDRVPLRPRPRRRRRHDPVRRHEEAGPGADRRAAGRACGMPYVN